MVLRAEFNTLGKRSFGPDPWALLRTVRAATSHALPAAHALSPNLTQPKERGAVRGGQRGCLPSSHDCKVAALSLKCRSARPQSHTAGSSLGCGRTPHCCPHDSLTTGTRDLLGWALRATPKER